MFRIRRVYDASLEIDRQAIDQVVKILSSQFAAVPAVELRLLPQKLANPLKYQFRTILFVAENQRHEVKGCAILNHAPDLGFCFLDYISVKPGRGAGGIGGALYERVREECRTLGVHGLFMECLPDEPQLCADRDMVRQNRARLRFYEQYGARPIINTAYETPLQPGDDCPPYLVFDNLGNGRLPGLAEVRPVVRAILLRKYAASCPPGYIDLVVESFRDDPIVLRSARLAPTSEVSGNPSPAIVPDRLIPLVVNEGHDIHHVRERGYVEAPVRIKAILGGLEPSGLFVRMAARHFSEAHIKQVHDPGYVEYLKRVCTRLEPGKSVYPYVFPIRNAAKPPKELPIRAGYYCIDTFTPLNRNAYQAAKGAVDCGLTAASLLLQGYRLSYALVRPPGHHAERRAFGGFCYFNTAAIAGDFLSERGRVAVLDVDYHHGNGTQNIFYERSDVLTLSIHGHPGFAYPYFSGFGSEVGDGGGKGFNRNYPLPEEIDGENYRRALEKALARVRNFRPKFLVVALGLDTARKDPTGTWVLAREDFFRNGRLIGRLELPTVVIQEGGYLTRTLGTNARSFFQGLWQGMYGPK
ncbi:MAG: histone deacetylase family protein [Desulfobulbaceae bacterium]|nr:histone deacetylase family protein [Desulfobulbaceae bacterium]